MGSQRAVKERDNDNLTALWHFYFETFAKTRLFVNRFTGVHNYCKKKRYTILLLSFYIHACTFAALAIAALLLWPRPTNAARRLQYILL